MAQLSLFRPRALDAPCIVRAHDCIDVATFVGTVQSLYRHLPAARHVVNLCTSRYRFLAAFVAACLREQVTLLPPNQSAAALDDLREQFPAQYVCDDAAVDALLNRHPPQTATDLPDWHIDGEQIAAIAFTSGSTGKPQAHAKTWGMLFGNAQRVAKELLGDPASQSVATVPAQHVYGLETSTLTALTGECAVFDDKPFFPADVRDALAAARVPRTLFTTPTHLRALLSANVAMPAIQAVVSATAPLDIELARRVETAWGTRVFEIYGCTEAGIVGRRRTIEQQPWHTFADGRVARGLDAVEYSAPQCPDRVPLHDAIDIVSTEEFWVHGRADDMIKVAGKRASLQALTQAMLDIDGVTDASVFVPDRNDTHEMRPAALVVAPQLSAHAIAHALSDRIDPVFIPRPLILLPALPRNELGKLPRAVLLAALERHRKAGKSSNELP